MDSRSSAAENHKSETTELSIIVPTYREADNIEYLITSIAAALSGTRLGYEIIIVDDNSQDGSEQIVEELAAEGYPVRIITRVDERGLSSAVIRGFQEARGRVLLCMDADLSHPPEAIPRLLAALNEPQVTFALGSRYVPGASSDEDWGLYRWLNSKFATLLARPLTRVQDPMSGFFAIPREVFEQAAPLNPIGYKIGLELLVKCNCRQVREIPIHFADRRAGQSKLCFKEQLNYIRHIKRLLDFEYGWSWRLLLFRRKRHV